MDLPYPYFRSTVYRDVRHKKYTMPYSHRVYAWIKGQNVRDSFIAFPMHEHYKWGMVSWTGK